MLPDLSFNWQPFAVDADLSLKSSNREILIKKSSVIDSSALISEDPGDVFSSFLLIKIMFQRQNRKKIHAGKY